MSSTVSASAKGASYLVLIQVSSRAFTFLVNQILLSYLSPALLGASMQLELYSITVLYFARESLRITLQRQTTNLQAIVNVAYIPLMLGVPLSVFISFLYEHGNLPAMPYMVLSIRLYGLAAMIELASEPCFALVQNQLAYSVRAAAETTATITRCMVMFIAAIWSHKLGKDIGVLPFAFGQMTYAICLVATYLLRTTPIARRSQCALTIETVDPKSVESRFSKIRDTDWY